MEKININYIAYCDNALHSFTIFQGTDSNEESYYNMLKDSMPAFKKRYDFNNK